MSTNFQIIVRQVEGNLYLDACGDFNGSSAWELVHLLHKRYPGRGTVTIDTSRLRNICPFGCCTFRCRLDPRRVPLQRLRFRGEGADEIAPEGSRVVDDGRHRAFGCDGDCRECRCDPKRRKS